MLLLLDIDPEMADLIDEADDDQGVAESIISMTFGLSGAEIVRDADGSIGVGVTFIRKVTLPDVLPSFNCTIERLRSFLQRHSPSVFLSR